MCQTGRSASFRAGGAFSRSTGCEQAADFRENPTETARVRQPVSRLAAELGNAISSLLPVRIIRGVLGLGADLRSGRVHSGADLEPRFAAPAIRSEARESDCGQSRNSAGRDTRVLALDGLRGCLATLIVIGHSFEHFHGDILFMPGLLAVLIFFLISACVLTRSWDGRYLTFLMRRFIRLWPAYALCLTAAYIIADRSPLWSQFFWYPFFPGGDPRLIDGPMWSLILEAWMMPLMPLIVWAATGGLARAMLAALLAAAMIPFTQFALMPVIFIAGAYFHSTDFRNRWLETRPFQWLGKISYSLYLSHVLVIMVFVKAFGPLGSVISLPFSFLVAWALWFAVEQPSITLSRRAGQIFRTPAAAWKSSAL